MIDGKKILITGGTGSFGNAVLKDILKKNVKEVRIFSRDEKKQNDMRELLNDDRIKFMLGDVRDQSSVKRAVDGVNYIFHAAALKQVPSCEFYPSEAVKTNVLGTENVLDAAIDMGVERVICLSTDKAVYPINAMGMSKALMEKIAIAKARQSEKTLICVTRYGNVMGSRGSVIPLFVDQISNNKPLSLTDPNMTRFMMSLDDAVQLVMFAFKHAKGGDIFVQKAPATTIQILATAIKDIMKKPNYPVKLIGTRHGEKLYEVLLSKEERMAAIDLGEYFRVEVDDRDLNYSSYFEKGNIEISRAEEYTSHNTERLTLAKMKELLKKIKFLEQTY